MSTGLGSNPEVVHLVETAVEALIAAKVDKASARCDLRLALRDRGFVDLSYDDDWLNGVLDLNFTLRCEWRSYDWSLAHPEILVQWPAQELCRGGYRRVHRDWLRRWSDLGGRLYDARMIALKDDPIWLALSDFRFPFPPFALGSGMVTQSVNRQLAQKLRVIDWDCRVSPPQPVPRPKLILLDPTP